MEVRIRTYDDAKAVHLGEVALDLVPLNDLLRLLPMWGVRDGYGTEYGTGDLVGQFVFEDDAAFFEIVLCKEDE